MITLLFVVAVHLVETRASLCRAAEEALLKVQAIEESLRLRLTIKLRLLSMLKPPSLKVTVFRASCPSLSP